MDYKLMVLDAEARKYIRTDSYLEGPIESINSMLKPFKPTIERNIRPLIEIVLEAMNLYQEKKLESDAWLAPRVHASLRLFREEAADPGIWDFLGIALPELRKYIYWRWQNNGKVSENRVFANRHHAIGRLWWTAELTRNGNDYSHTSQAFEGGGDLINYLTDVDAFHNRAAALAYVRSLRNSKSGNPRPAKDSVELGKKFNHILTTIILDSIAPEPGPDHNALILWIREEPDETLMLAQMPIGPSDPPVSEERISAICALMDELLEEIDSESDEANLNFEILENLGGILGDIDFENINPKKVRLSLLDRSDKIHRKSGLNWGQREGRNPNQAYIPVPAKIHRKYPDFFPDKGKKFRLATDDGKLFTASIAQQGGKAIEIPEDNSSLGIYFRKRIGKKLGEFVEKEDLDQYGRTNVDIMRLNEQTFIMDFSV